MPETADAILYVQRTGCDWSDLPPELGDDATANRRFQEWRRVGLWEQIGALAQPSEPAGDLTTSEGD